MSKDAYRNLPLNLVVRDGRQLAQPNRSRAGKGHGLAQGVRISPWHGDFQIDLRRGLPPSLSCPVEAVCKIDRERSACGGMAGQPDIHTGLENVGMGLHSLH
jgi:hypothetical protein